MRSLQMQLLVAILAISLPAVAQEPNDDPTPFSGPIIGRTGDACDYDRFLKEAIAIQDYRKTHLLTAARFAEMAAQTGTVIVDARSPAAFAECHVCGSINIPYTDFTIENLDRKLPDRDARILIYCRNNLNDDSVHELSVDVKPSILPFIESKQVFAGLNIPTFITLSLYGYSNVWELDDVVDPRYTSIRFEFSEQIRRKMQPKPYGIPNESVNRQTN